ncbi:hypothetical protein HN682_09500 [Candidatus Peregrinibacteria bacterium]|jgi:hypothetical protein|nr:hypothetical protein [Candidatus Peregrinibacteria bacterium]
MGKNGSGNKRIYVLCDNIAEAYHKAARIKGGQINYVKPISKAEFEEAVSSKYD